MLLAEEAVEIRVLCMQGKSIENPLSV